MRKLYKPLKHTDLQLRGCPAKVLASQRWMLTFGGLQLASRARKQPFKTVEAAEQSYLPLMLVM